MSLIGDGKNDKIRLNASSSPQSECRFSATGLRTVSGYETFTNSTSNTSVEFAGIGPLVSFR